MRRISEVAPLEVAFRRTNLHKDESMFLDGEWNFDSIREPEVMYSTEGLSSIMEEFEELEEVE